MGETLSPFRVGPNGNENDPVADLTFTNTHLVETVSQQPLTSSPFLLLKNRRIPLRKGRGKKSNARVGPPTCGKRFPKSA